MNPRYPLFTAKGRATIAALQMNRPTQLAARKQWAALGLFT